MDTNRQTKVRQILKAIEYGNIPREEIRQRLQQIIDDELSGAVEAKYDQEKIEICSDLLMRVTSGEPFPEINDTTQAVEQISVNVEKTRKRRRVARYVLRTAAAVLVIVVGLIAAGVISPIRWFTKRSSEDEQQYIVQGHEISIGIETISAAIAEHEQSGLGTLSSTDQSEIICFLGFDPRIPNTLADGFTLERCDIIINSMRIHISCNYTRDDSSITNSIVKLNIYYCTDMEEAYFTMEQNEEGEIISIYNVDVYRTKNYDRNMYNWTQGCQIMMFRTRESTELAEKCIEEIIKYQTGN